MLQRRTQRFKRTGVDKMKISEAINQLKNLMKKHGDVDIDIYLSYSKENRGEPEIYFDEELNVVSLAVYG